MQKLKYNFKYLLALALIPLFNLCYFALNSSSRGVRSLALGIDRAVPFIKEFGIPYMLWYPFIIMTMVYLCFNDRNTYFRVLSGILLGSVVCYIIFFFFQTTVQRPQLAENDIFSRVVAFVYALDEPYNCFPSIHVLECYIVFRGVMTSKARNTAVVILTGICSLVITLSTQFIKQHVILDIVGAVVLGEIVFILFAGTDWDLVLGWIKKQYETIVL
jgi:membrane-associated phospholipid phosphatase